MHQRQAEAALPDEIVLCEPKQRARWAMLMVDAGEHAQVWLCKQARVHGKTMLTAVRRLDAVPRGERHDSGVLPNSLTFRAANVLGVARYHLCGSDLRSVGGAGSATVVNRDYLTVEVAALGGAWRSAYRLGIHPRKIRDALEHDNEADEISVKKYE